jgi:hypothetical protein
MAYGGHGHVVRDKGDIPIFSKDKNMNQHFKKKEHESNIHWNLVVLITTCRKNM